MVNSGPELKFAPVVLGRLPDKKLNEDEVRQKFAELWKDPVICIKPLQFVKPACKRQPLSINRWGL
jgi:hypothetical protein